MLLAEIMEKDPLQYSTWECQTHRVRPPNGCTRVLILNQYYQEFTSILRAVKDLTLDGALGWPDKPLQQVEEVDLLHHIARELTSVIFLGLLRGQFVGQFRQR